MHDKTSSANVNHLSRSAAKWGKNQYTRSKETKDATTGPKIKWPGKSGVAQRKYLHNNTIPNTKH